MKALQRISEEPDLGCLGARYPYWVTGAFSDCIAMRCRQGIQVLEWEEGPRAFEGVVGEYSLIRTRGAQREIPVEVVSATAARPRLAIGLHLSTLTGSKLSFLGEATVGLGGTRVCPRSVLIGRGFC